MTGKHVKKSPAEIRREQRRREQQERQTADRWEAVKCRYGNWFRPDDQSAEAQSKQRFFSITRNTKFGSYDEPLLVTVARLLAKRLWINSAPPMIRRTFASDPGFQQQFIQHVLRRLPRYGDMCVVYDEHPLPRAINWEPTHIGGNFFLTREKISMPLKYYLFFVEQGCEGEILAEWSGIPVKHQEEFLNTFTEWFRDELTDEVTLMEEYGKPVMETYTIGNLYFNNGSNVGQLTVTNNYNGYNGQ